MTNNPNKIEKLRHYGINIIETKKIICNRPEVISYLKEKELVLGHEF